MEWLIWLAIGAVGGAIAGYFGRYWIAERLANNNIDLE